MHLVWHMCVPLTFCQSINLNLIIFCGNKFFEKFKISSIFFSFRLDKNIQRKNNDQFFPSKGFKSITHNISDVIRLNQFYTLLFAIFQCDILKQGNDLCFKKNLQRS